MQRGMQPHGARLSMYAAAALSAILMRVHDGRVAAGLGTLQPSHERPSHTS